LQTANKLSLQFLKKLPNSLQKHQMLMFWFLFCVFHQNFHVSSEMFVSVSVDPCVYLEIVMIVLTLFDFLSF
jgi:hypothetical protein